MPVMGELPTLTFKTIPEYYSWVLDYVGTMQSRKGLAPKERDFLLCMLMCQKLGIKFMSPEFQKQLELRGWFPGHISTYKGVLIKKGWIGEDDNDPSQVKLCDNFDALLNTPGLLTIQFNVEVVDLTVPIQG